MPSDLRPSLRRVLALAGLVCATAGASGCGEKSAPPDPNSRGVWLYGVAKSDTTIVKTESTGTYVPPPVAAATVKPAAAEAPPAAPTPSAPAAPPPEPAGAYKVVEVKDGGSIHVVCRLTGAPATLETVTAFKHRDLGCTDHKTERCRFVKKGEGDLRLANCLVYLRSIKAGKAWPGALATEDRTFVMDQKACVYVPHVGWTRPGTQVVVVNSDRADHNIHGNFGSETKFNFGSEPGTRKDSITEAFLENPGAYVVKCDIHPWMNATIHLVSNPYAAVTPEVDGDGGAAGEATLDDVPPGTYEIRCWHEGMVSQATELNGVINGYAYSPDVDLPQSVTVEPKGRQEVVFSVPYK
jgi:plastocyanin